MHANILKKNVGADRVVMAESETGIRLGKSLISGGFQDFFMLSDSLLHGRASRAGSVDGA